MKDIGVRLVVDDSHRYKFATFATAAERAASDINSRISAPLYRAELSLNRLGTAASRAAQVGFSVLTASVGALSYAMTGLAKEFIEVNERFGNLQITLTSALRSFRAGRDIVRELAQYTAKSPLPFQALAETVQSFSVIPQSSNRLLDQVRRGTLGRSDGFLKQALQTVESMNVFRPDQNASSAVFAIREALGGQLRSLVRRFDIPTTLLQRTSGLTTAELRRDPDRMFDAIYKLFTDIVTPEATYRFARQPSKLLQNTREQLLDIPLQRLGQGATGRGSYRSSSALFERLLTSGQSAFDTLTNTMRGDVDAQGNDQFEERFGLRIRTFVSRFIDRFEGTASGAIDKMLDKLGVKQSDNKVERFVEGLVKGLEAALEFLNNVSDKLVDVGPAIVDVFGGIFKVVGKVFDLIVWVKDKFGPLVAGGLVIASPVILANMGSLIALLGRDLPRAVIESVRAISGAAKALPRTALGASYGMDTGSSLANFLGSRGLMKVDPVFKGPAGLMGSDFTKYVAAFKANASSLGFNDELYRRRAYTDFVRSDPRTVPPPGVPFTYDMARRTAKSVGLPSVSAYFGAGGGGSAALEGEYIKRALKQYGLDDEYLKKNPRVAATLLAGGVDLSSVAGISREVAPQTRGQAIRARIGGAVRGLGSMGASALQGGVIGLASAGVAGVIGFFIEQLTTAGNAISEFNTQVSAKASEISASRASQSDYAFIQYGGGNVGEVQRGIDRDSRFQASIQTYAASQRPGNNWFFPSYGLTDSQKKNLRGQYFSPESGVGEDQLYRLASSGFFELDLPRLQQILKGDQQFSAAFPNGDIAGAVRADPMRAGDAMRLLLSSAQIQNKIAESMQRSSDSFREAAKEASALAIEGKYGGGVGAALLAVLKGEVDPRNAVGVTSALLQGTDYDKYSQASRLITVPGQIPAYAESLDYLEERGRTLSPGSVFLRELNDLESKLTQTEKGALGGQTREEFLASLNGSKAVVAANVARFVKELSSDLDSRSKTLTDKEKQLRETLKTLDPADAFEKLVSPIVEGLKLFDVAGKRVAVAGLDKFLTGLENATGPDFDKGLQTLSALYARFGEKAPTISKPLTGYEGLSAISVAEYNANRAEEFAVARRSAYAKGSLSLDASSETELEGLRSSAVLARYQSRQARSAADELRRTRFVGELLSGVGRSSYLPSEFQDSRSELYMLGAGMRPDARADSFPTAFGQGQASQLSTSRALLQKILEDSEKIRLTEDERLKVNQELARVLSEQSELRHRMTSDGFVDGFRDGILTLRENLMDLATVGQTLGATIRESLGSAFDTIAMNIRDAGAAAKQFALDVLGMIRKIFAQKAAEALLNMLFSSFSFGRSTSPSSSFSGNSTVAPTSIWAGTSYGGGGSAAGGYTGHGAKYQIAGYVHRGEYVLPQESVSRIGVSNLDRLRYATMPGYAAGGYVTPMASGGGGGGRISVSVTVNNNGSTSTDFSATDGLVSLGATIAQLVDSQVTERLIQEGRPGGMFNSNS